MWEVSSRNTIRNYIFLLILLSLCVRIDDRHFTLTLVGYSNLLQLFILISERICLSENGRIPVEVKANSLDNGL
jgi:hypothetical protein